MTANERFIAIREKMGLTQSDFAKKCNSSGSIISEIESGKRDIPRSIIIALIASCSVSSDWLLTGRGDMFFTDNLLQKTDIRIPLLRQTR